MLIKMWELSNFQIVFVVVNWFVLNGPLSNVTCYIGDSESF